VNKKQQLDSKLADIIGSNEDAVRFLKAFNDYCHLVDDIIDEYSLKFHPVPPEMFFKHCINAAELYSSRFYQRHVNDLFPIVIQITSAYADSVNMEKSNIEWKRQASDTLRQAGNDMIMMIVFIIGGWDKKREISELVREVSYQQHHDETGKQI
jgi:hypothetical protein